MTGGSHYQQNRPKNHFEMVKGDCLVLKVKVCMLSSIEVRGGLLNSATSSGGESDFTQKQINSK
jgi:hypothetical protein